MDRRSLLSLTALAPLALLKSTPAQATTLVPEQGPKDLQRALATITVGVDHKELEQLFPRSAVEYPRQPGTMRIEDSTMMRLFRESATKLTVAPDLSLPLEVSVITKDGSEWGARDGRCQPAVPLDKLVVDDKWPTRHLHNADRAFNEYPYRVNPARVFQGEWYHVFRPITSREHRDRQNQFHERLALHDRGLLSRLEAFDRQPARLDRSEIDHLLVQFFFWTP